MMRLSAPVGTPGEADHRDSTAVDHVGKDLSWSHRWKLVDIADEQERCPIRHGAKQRVLRRTSIIDASSTSDEVAFEGEAASRRAKPTVTGSTSSRRWMVFASGPAASLRRLAARPVGAHRGDGCALHADDLEERIHQRGFSNARTASDDHHLRRVPASMRGVGFRQVGGRSASRPTARPSGSIQGQGSVPFARRISRSAMVRSARCRPARNT